jgi:hypothetical protein
MAIVIGVVVCLVSADGFVETPSTERIPPISPFTNELAADKSDQVSNGCAHYQANQMLLLYCRKKYAFWIKAT